MNLDDSDDVHVAVDLCPPPPPPPKLTAPPSKRAFFQIWLTQSHSPYLLPLWGEQCGILASLAKK
jgi:hypothetical protein